MKAKMTLNLIVNNMVAVDSEISSGYRTTDDWKKIELFERDGYHGAVIGNGNGLTLLDAQATIRASSASSVDELANILETRIHESHQKHVDEYRVRIREQIEMKHSLVSDPAKREAMVAQEFAAAMDQLHKSLAEENRQGMVYLVACNKKTGQLHKRALPDKYIKGTANFDGVPVIPDGSGGDLAGAYVGTQTSGVDWDDITPEQNFYLIALGCAAATANAGVGGYMKIVVVKKEGVEFIEQEKVNAAVRVCSKQIAGDISKKNAMTYVADILTGKADYAQIANVLDITESDLRYTPTSVNTDVSKFNSRLGKD